MSPVRINELRDTSKSSARNSHYGRQPSAAIDVAIAAIDVACAEIAVASCTASAAIDIAVRRQC
jgi:hypothetical protein